MISEFFLNIVFSIVEGLLSFLPQISIPAVMARDSTFFGAVRCVLYMLPLDTIGTIIGLIVAITGFRIVISLIKTIWDLLPLV